MKRLLAATILLTTFAAALAASDRREPSPLDDRVRHREGGSISTHPRDVDDLAPSDALRSRWRRFRERHAGDWSVHVDGRTGMPTLLSGSGIPWLSEPAAAGATLEELDRLARTFLETNADVFGSWSDLLDLDRAASRQLREAHWQIVYRQVVGGVRVENARLDLHVVRGRLVMAGAEHWSRPAAGGVPELDAPAARERLDAYVGEAAAGLIAVGEPQLVLMAAEAGRGLTHTLAWRFTFDEADAPRSWIGEVDARDGSILSFYEGTRYGSVRGGVFPLSPDGDCTNGGCEAAEMPMPYADATEAGQAEQFGDAYGNLVCVEPAGATETNLVGRYIRIVDACGALTQTATCGGGLTLGTKAGENCAVAPGASPGNTAATRTAFYHMNRVAQIARFYDPANVWLNGTLTVNVNVTQSCNANWTGTVVNMFRAGSNCNNTGENAGILVHEWGHGYDQNDGGGVDKPSEAYSDIVNILATRASCQGHGTYNDGSTCSGYGDACLTCTGFREFDWNQRQSRTPATPANFAFARCSQDFSSFSGPCKREPHCESYVSSEAIYDLATRDLPAAGLDQASAWQLVDRLWYATRPGSGGNAYTCSASASDSCLATSWYQRMRVADDDDGNLANGTPHAAALFAAFKRHEIACGLASDTRNQNHTSCPALAAPVVTKTVSPAGVELAWGPVSGAASYRVFRGELGCGRQQVPIATRTSAQTSYLDDSADSSAVRHYRVQAFGSNGACFSPVSNCVGAPAGGRLRQTAHRVIDGGNTTPEPGETIELAATLLNEGAEAALSPVASVSVVAPAHVRVLNPTATWPTIAASATAESVAPQARLVILPEAQCGQTLTVDLAGAASNSPSFGSRIAIPMGNPNRDYTQEDIVIVPPLTTTPAVAQFVIADDRPIAELDLSVDIFHQDPTQLVVSLTSPQGTTVRLHDRGPAVGNGIVTRYDRDTAPSGPGSMADFVGQSTLGTWTLSVEDLDGSGITTDGYIRPRTLHVTARGAYGCDVQGCADPVPAAAPALQVQKVDDGSQLDLVFSWSAVAGAGYHVLQSTGPTFASDVTLLANPATATTFTLQDGVNTTPALTFFQVKAVNSCHHEGP
ncbi:MAG TPA: proprotein convertase P-domain-containing protein [Candidatus Polarisedimenticolaceae bacterium]